MKLSMRQQILPWSGLAVLAALMLFMSMVNVPSQAAPAPTQARFATPLASPTNNGGNAKWTVKQMSFVSHYPGGFDFVLDVSSSAGKVALATVMWRHSTTVPNTMLGTLDESGKFVAQWKPLADHNIPQWVGIDYWWVVTDGQGNQFETPHGYIEYADNTRKWKRLVSEDAVIHWEASLPAELGTEVASALKRQRPFYMKAWGKLLDYKPQIIIYADADPWKEWQSTVDVNSVDGETDPHWGSTVQLYRTDAPDPVQYLADGVVLHEVEHLYQQTFGAFGSYRTAVWFYEGDATYLELYQPYDYLQAVKTLAAKGQLPTLAELSKRADDRSPYDVGYAFWKYLEVNYGADTHRKVWEQIGKGQPIILALQKATGQKFPDLEANFRVWLGAR